MLNYFLAILVVNKEIYCSTEYGKKISKNKCKIKKQSADNRKINMKSRMV